ncbi:hypothetical protein R6Q59_030099 [Mikania micrantha]
MADAIAALLKEMLSEIHYFNSLNGDPSLELRYHKRDLCDIFQDLLKHLRSMLQGYVNEEIKILFSEMEFEIYEVYRHRVERRQVLGSIILVNCERLLDIIYGSNTEGEETVVGFDDEMETLLDQLTATSSKQLQVFSIAGMAGLGKTTLARKLYTDPLIDYTFDFRAWICVSQTYIKRDLLLGILGSFITDLTDETYQMSDQQLGEKLYRLLKGRKYLVVLDDIWDSKIWNELRIYFPDDKVGSRVLITSRDIELSSHLQAAKPTHVLRLRTEDESWAIFLKKVFRTGFCPPWLKEHADVIIRKCEGLPLAIVITAGLLKNDFSVHWWLHMSASLHSFMLSDPSQYMDSLALSYSHLPHHLRHCFVFVGVFPEDYDIPVTKLIWLWIAQGFIHETESRILEDVAEDVFQDLIKRSLLMIAKKRADGQIKTCRIHDLLRDLCLKKANEENFSQQVHINPPELLSSEFRYPYEFGELLQKGASLDTERYKRLRILDVESVLIPLFPSDITKLVNLRYLAIQAHDGNPTSSISSLTHLQMLIISSRKNIVVPKTIWAMVNLRHLYIKTGENLIEDPCFVQETDKDSSSSGLASLQTLSQVSPRSCKNIFSATPSLRKLGFCGPLVSSQGEIEFPNIRSLQQLQKLKLLNTIPYGKPTRLLNTMMFPEKLKKLTLSNTCMDWEDMWVISLLSNLEVLKLKFHACIGDTWETSDAEFKQLKILKLKGLNLKQWVCWKENFPGLQRLVVHQCLKLDSIPSDLGKIITLEVIEVQWCSNLAQVSALEIQKEHESEGNFFLKVHASNNH